MELRPGYKSTEIGVIPEDWDVTIISALATPVRGGSPRPAGDPRYFNGSFKPWLTVAALTNLPENDIWVRRTETSLTELGVKFSRELPSGTIIIANSGATLGVAKMLGIDCCANDGVAALLDLDHEVYPEFIVHFINSITSFLRETVATGNGQPNLNTDRIAQLRVPFPKPSEQKGIAEALSDVNASIGALSRLIAKKRDLRQGAMQRLLTGQTRLPGFTAPWQEKRLGELAIVRSQKVIGSALPKGTPCVELDQIASGSGQLIATGTASSTSVKNRFEVGDVLFGRLRAYLRKFWLADLSGVCSTEIWPLVPVEGEATSGFVFYTIQRSDFIDAASQSYGTHMPRSDWGVVKNFEVLTPRPDEQNAIAAVLSDMDAEIAALDARLDKTRALKLAMMQALLTGRVRLPVRREAAQQTKEAAHV